MPNTSEGLRQQLAPRTRLPAKLALVFAALALGILASASLYYQASARQFTAQAERQLIAVAELKVSEIAQWRRERFSDARFFQGNPALRALVAEFMSAPDDPALQSALAAWFSATSESHGYEVTILDTYARPMLMLPASQPPLDSYLGPAIEAAMAGSEIVMVDLYRSDADARPRMALLMPLSDPGERPLGLLLWRLDPDNWLYQKLRHQPVPGAAYESFLLRREAQEAVILSGLAANPDAALNVRLPLTEAGTPAVRAALGDQGVISARDDSGEPVRAALLPVPDAPWHLVISVALTDLSAPLRNRLAGTIAVVAALLAASATSVLLLWREHQRRHLQSQLVAARALAGSEAKLRRLNVELEQRVTERTRELEAKNRSLESFTYSVSHDLKAPLRGLDGYSRLLLADHAAALDDEGREFLENIRKATGQMSELIEDLLQYSRMETRPLELKRVALADVIEEVLAHFAGEIAERGTELQVSVGDLRVLADPHALAIVLRNLVDNAIKFSRDADHPRLEISASAAPGQILLRVSDNGIGFDERFAERIFDIFQRLHRSEDFPGTGIGLAIVRKVMDRLNGRVSARSKPGAGATFTLELPA